MAVFIFFERGASAEAKQKELAKIEADKAEQTKKDNEKKALEEKARIDSEKRNAERIKTEQENEAKKKAEYDAKIQKMKDEIKRYTDDVDANKKLADRLDKELAGLRDRRDKENRENFELAKKVEISKKLRRDAELEVQRFNAMLADRANQSILAKAPEVAAAPASH
jgi:translation initiation factor IF-2